MNRDLMEQSSMTPLDGVVGESDNCCERGSIVGCGTKQVLDELKYHVREAARLIQVIEDLGYELE